MKSLEQKKIRAIAQILPSSLYACSEPVEISGEDLLLSGTKKVEGKDVEAEKVYYMQSPVYREKNHYRRIKKAFISKGKKGVELYIKDFMQSPEKAELIVKVLLP